MKKLNYELFRPTHSLSEWLEGSETLVIEVDSPVISTAKTVKIKVDEYTPEDFDYTQEALNTAITLISNHETYSESIRRILDKTIVKRVIEKFNNALGTHLEVIDFDFVNRGYSDMEYTLTGPDHDLLIYEAWFNGEIELDIYDPDKTTLENIQDMPDEELIDMFNDYHSRGNLWEDHEEE